VVRRTKRGRPRASEDRTQVTSQGPMHGIRDPWSAGNFRPAIPFEIRYLQPLARLTAGLKGTDLAFGP